MSLFHNKVEGRLRAPWRIALNFLLFFIGTNISGAAAGIAGVSISMALGWLPLETLSNPENMTDTVMNLLLSSPLVFFLSSVGSLLVIVIVTAVSARWIDRRRFTDYGLNISLNWWGDLAFGLLLGAVLISGIFLFERQAGWLRITGYMQSPNNLAFLPAFLMMLLSFLAVGIYEELLVRGYQMRNIAEGLHTEKVSKFTALILSYILTSAWFSLLHLFNPNTSLASVINLVVSGFFLGLGMVLTGRLALPIGLHITWNFFQGTIFGFPVSGLNTKTSLIAIKITGPTLWTGGDFGPEAGLIGLVAMLLGMGAILMYVKLSNRSLSAAAHLSEYRPPHKKAVDGQFPPSNSTDL